MTKIYLKDFAGVRKLFEIFKEANGRYPNRGDLGRDGLPTVRTLERRWGGLVGVRKKLGVKEVDGRCAGNRAGILAQSYDDEWFIFEFLVEMFGVENVERGDGFYVTGLSENFFVKVFNPGNILNLNTCLNARLDRLNEITRDGRVFLVCMNPEIRNDEIEKLMTNKKKKMLANLEVVSLEKFEAFVESVVVVGSHQLKESLKCGGFGEKNDTR